MSTNIFKSETFELTQFCGPSTLVNRNCLQITVINNFHAWDYLQFTKEDIQKLIPELQKWIDNYDK